MKQILTLAKTLEENKIPYQFAGLTSLDLQGVDMGSLETIYIDVQWDVLDEVYQLFLDHHPSKMTREVRNAFFTFMQDGKTVLIHCDFNTTIRTNPYRIPLQSEGFTLWCLSIYAYIYNPKTEPELAMRIHHHLLTKQNEMTKANQKAWNQNNYLALINRFGEPSVVAAKIKENPEWRLHPFLNHLGELKGKKVLHLMGSNGVKGVALSLLGADVTIVDFSSENERFAKEVATSAGVSLHYVISDVLNLPETIQNEAYDLVLMELGVLHYFIDLHPLFATIAAKLGDGGMFLVHEFHPISTKLITSSGKKHKVTGNYFDPALEDVHVAFSKHIGPEQQGELAKSLHRKWTLGEMITSVGQSGLKITVLEEEPNHKIHDTGLPKTFTLVAVKS